MLGACSVLALVFFNLHALNIALTAAAGFFVIGGQYVLNNYAAASYETRFRATGVGMELSVGRVGAILGPFVVGSLQQIYAGPTAMFIAIAGAAFIAALTMVAVGAARSSGSEAVASKAAA